MRLKPLVTALCAGALLAATPFAQAKDLKSIGVTVGDLANPFFVQITKGAELEARKLARGQRQGDAGLQRVRSGPAGVAD